MSDYTAGLSPWAAVFAGANGTLSMGGASNNIGIIEIDGLEDMPGMRTGDTPYGRGPGVLTGLDFPDARTFTVSLEFTPDSGSTMAKTIQRITSILMPSVSTEYPFIYYLPGTDAKQVMCRVRKRTAPIDISYVGGLAAMTVQFVASDPNKYDANYQTSSVGITSTTSGATFPATFPFTFGSATATNIVNIVNQGNTTMFPVLTVSGGVATNPVITNLTTGDTLGITYTLGAFDSMTLDCKAHTCVINGGYRAAAVTNPGWIGLVPGTNQIQFRSSDVAATGAQLSINWSSAWL